MTIPPKGRTFDTEEHLAKVLAGAYGEALMKFAEHVKPKFDPRIRITDSKNMHIVLTPFEWCGIESSLGRHVGPDEIKELILGLFSGTYKLVKR